MWHSEHTLSAHLRAHLSAAGRLRRLPSGAVVVPRLGDLGEGAALLGGWGGRRCGGWRMRSLLFPLLSRLPLAALSLCGGYRSFDSSGHVDPGRRRRVRGRARPARQLEVGEGTGLHLAFHLEDDGLAGRGGGWDGEGEARKPCLWWEEEGAARVELLVPRDGDVEGLLRPLLADHLPDEGTLDGNGDTRIGRGRVLGCDLVAELDHLLLELVMDVPVVRVASLCIDCVLLRGP